MKRHLTFFAATLPALFVLCGRAALAASFGGGNGGSWAFVAPVNGLAGAMTAVVAALVVIAIVAMVAWHIIHHHGGELGSLVGKVLVLIIGGAIVATAANFLSNAGVQAAVIPR